MFIIFIINSLSTNTNTNIENFYILGQISELTPQQISTFKQFTLEQISALTPDQISAFTPQQIPLLKIISSFTKQQISALTPYYINEFSLYRDISELPQEQKSIIQQKRFKY